MKPILSACLAALLILVAALALAVPQLGSVFAGDAALTAGQDGWYFDFLTSEGGTLAMQLLDANTGDPVADLGAVQVEAGSGRIGWNGLLPDGSAVSPGSYMVAVRLQNFWGEQSEQSTLSLTVLAADAQGSPTQPVSAADASSLQDAAAGMPSESLDPAAMLAAQNAQAQGQAEPEQAVPQATSFWDMNPDDYDLTNPDHQQAIWDLMMQPITVLDVGQTEHVYPTNKPGIERKPYQENTAGELHGQSQGVHVLEEDTDGDGYVRIEAYSNDGTKTDNAFMESLDAKLIQGYVKENLLMRVTPSDRYALLIDKLRQKLYIFEDGRIIGELLVSTGLNNEKQPYNETPAGEFITVSRVGLFVSGSMRADYAIRINGGTLLHEVPYRYGADGKTKMYTEFEGELGQKASHACIRIQRRKNAEGQNMAWLWDNLELKTKVFIWDDQGRRMYDPEIPDASLQLYRNPNGGSNYHLDANCPGVKKQYLPLTGDFTYGQLDEEPFDKLTPCPYCAAPQRLETLYERYLAAAEQIGAQIPDDAKARFGL